jgi:hypothetical protein
MLLAAVLVATLVTAQVETVPMGPLAAVNARYEQLWAGAKQAPKLPPASGHALDDLFGDASQTLRALVARPDAARLADLTVRSELDALAVRAVLAGTVIPLATAPGAHAGVVRVRDAFIPFAYRLPAGFDARRAAPIVVLVHGHGQPPTDLVTRSFLAALADRSGAILLAPGGDDTDPDAVTAGIVEAEAALGAVVHWDRSRRYLGGYSNGVFDAFHALVKLHEPCAGFLAISGVVLQQDMFAVRLRLARSGAYFVVGSSDPIVAPAAVRANVRSLRGGAVFAHYYEVPGGGHLLESLVPAIAQAWADMLGGVTRLPNDGLGPIDES